MTDDRAVRTATSRVQISGDPFRQKTMLIWPERTVQAIELDLITSTASTPKCQFIMRQPLQVSRLGQ